MCHKIHQIPWYKTSSQLYVATKKLYYKALKKCGTPEEVAKQGILHAAIEVVHCCWVTFWITVATYLKQLSMLSVVVVSQFNGTSTPKGSYSAKTGDNDCNVNTNRYTV